MINPKKGGGGDLHVEEGQVRRGFFHVEVGGMMPAGMKRNERWCNLAAVGKIWSAVWME